jgi:hypothetical protein
LRKGPERIRGVVKLMVRALFVFVFEKNPLPRLRRYFPQRGKT